MKAKRIIIIVSAVIVASVAVSLLTGIINLREQKVDDASSVKIYTENVLGLDMDMVWVEGGEYMMGATPEQEAQADKDEKPVHQVYVESFYLGKHEVTQRQWETVMGTTIKDQWILSRCDVGIYGGEGPNNPIFYVSWNEATDFCKKLSDLTGKKYVLPSEEQCEYAARGGNRATGTKYSGSNKLSEVGWSKGMNRGTRPVGTTKRPNSLGIYDMSGNVVEWCSNEYTVDYVSGPSTDPEITKYGTFRVARGGGWDLDDFYCRVSARIGYVEGNRTFCLGFRVACLE